MSSLPRKSILLSRPNFALLSTLPVDLKLVNKEDVDMKAIFSCGVLDCTTFYQDVISTGGIESKVLINEPQVELGSLRKAKEGELTPSSLPSTIFSGETLVLPHDLELSRGRVSILFLPFSASLGGENTHCY